MTSRQRGNEALQNAIFAREVALIEQYWEVYVNGRLVWSDRDRRSAAYVDRGDTVPVPQPLLDQAPVLRWQARANLWKRLVNTGYLTARKHIEPTEPSA